MGNGITHLSVGTSLTQAEYESTDAHVGGTGRTATYVIAASDAPTHVKAQADYVCDGTADNVEIQAAIDALPANGGIVHLSTGTFYIVTSLIAKDDLILEGESKFKTILSLINSVNAPIITDNSVGMDRVTIRNLELYGNRAGQGVTNTYGIMFSTSGNNNLVDNIYCKNIAGYGIGLRGDWMTISNCIFDTLDRAAITNTGYGSRGHIIDNKIWKAGVETTASYNAFAIAWGSGDGSFISRNEILQCYWGGIAFGGQGIVVSNNHISYGGSTDIALTSNSIGSIITGNSIYLGDSNGIDNFTHIIAEISNNSVYGKTGTASERNGICVHYDAQAATGIIISNNRCEENDHNGIVISATIVNTSTKHTVIGNTCKNNGNALGGDWTQNGILLWRSNYNLVDGNKCFDTQTPQTQKYGLAGVNGGADQPDYNFITNNDLRGNLTASAVNLVANNYASNNQGYIAPGEVRTVSGSLTGGAVNAILFAWHTPETQDVFITKVIIDITTADADAANIDVGIADDATYTNGGTEFFDDLKGETIQVNDSLVTTEHTQTIWVLCQDSASATDGWVVAKILDNDGTSIVGSYYIEYVGK